MSGLREELRAMEVHIFIFRVLAACLGLLLIFCSVFLYEDEESGVHNVFETAWIRLTDVVEGHKKAGVNYTVLIVKMASEKLDAIFGDRLFSRQAIEVSLILSFASVFILNEFMPFLSLGIFSHPIGESLWRMWLIYTGIKMASIVISASRSPEGKLRVSAEFWEIIFQITFVSIALLFLAEEPIGKYGIPVSFVWFAVLGFGFDVVFIAYGRWLLRISQASESSFFIILSSLTSSLIVFVLALSPLIVLLLIQEKGYEDQVTVWFPAFEYILQMSAAANLSSLVVVPIVLLLSVSLVIHRLFSEIILRSVYALQRFELLKQKKQVAALGIFLITMSLPSVGSAILEGLKSLKLL